MKRRTVLAGLGVATVGGVILHNTSQPCGPTDTAVEDLGDHLNSTATVMGEVVVHYSEQSWFDLEDPTGRTMVQLQEYVAPDIGECVVVKGGVRNCIDCTDMDYIITGADYNYHS